MESLSRNYISLLNEYQQKTRCTVEYEVGSTEGPSHNKTFTMRVIVNGQRFPDGTGKTKKEARQNAAKNALDGLKNSSNIGSVFGKNNNKAQGSEVAACSASLNVLSIADESQSSIPDNNYIAKLNDFCQKNKCVHDFKLLEKRGPPHNPEFVCKVVIDGKEYPEGQGKNLKEARQLAAQHAWTELRNQSGWTTQTGPSRNSAIKSEDAQLSLNSPCKTPSSGDSSVFKGPSAVSSPTAKRPTLSSLDAKPKIKLAANFHQSPNRLAQSKENPAKPSGGQTSSQDIKSRFLVDFDLISPLGHGTFGRVFKARRKLENKYYAVKIVKSREKARREVDALALFNNANIVRYFSAWREDTAYRHESSGSNSFSDSGSGPGTEFLYIQMELCEGDTLRAWIDNRNSLKECLPERRTDAARISREVLTAVEYIHSEGLIHRDLKPANIMFGSDGGVKVGDFGLVTAAENKKDEPLVERTIDTGSPSYMAPEQVTQYYDKKVDIYALGLVYFELLWKFDTMSERAKIWGAIRNRNFPLEFSKKYSFEHKLIERMLSASPEDRPDATELIRELDQYSTLLKTDKDIKTF